MRTTAHDFLDRLHEIPTIPKVVKELLATFERDDTTVDMVARLISSDPVISAKVLRLANSAFYKRARAFSNVNDAVMFIGLHATRTVVLGAALASSIKCPAGFQRESFWRYCLHTAVSARYFAKSAHADGDTAFTIGLIHAIGEPLMYASLAEQMLALDRKHALSHEDRATDENVTLGFCYSDVSADLAERWRFPEVMVDAIRHASQPLVGNSLCTMAGYVWLGARHAGAFELASTPLLQRMDLLPLVDRLHIPVSALHNLPSVTELAEGLEDLVS